MSSCKAFRDALHRIDETGLDTSRLEDSGRAASQRPADEDAPLSDALPAPLNGHLATCADCAAYVARVARSLAGLRGLERRPAPTELDGRVVAALQAGARQDRAVRALEELAPRTAPERVERAVQTDAELAALHPGRELRPTRLRAPQVLDRLVAEELGDPSAARARRFVSSLPRLEAPGELAARVASDLAGAPPTTLPAPVWTSNGGARSPRARGRLATVAAAAALLLLLLGPLRDGPQDTEPTRPRLRLQAASVGDLGPLARGMLDALGGGVLSAHDQATPPDGPPEDREERR